MIRLFLKIPAAVLLSSAYFAASLFIAVSALRGTTRRRRLAKNASFHARLSLALLGVKVRVRHRSRLPKGAGGRLIVSNHVSSLDILVLASRMPAVFITSVELRRSGLPGLFALCSGSLFVERRRAIALRREIGSVARRIREGLPVVLFPEGTTSDGTLVLPFKSALLDAAIKGKAGVLPLCLRYPKVNGKRLSPSVREGVFYHGIPFLRHLRALLSLRSIEAEIVVLEPIPAGMVTARKRMASLLHHSISEAYHGR